jgi:DNA-directed RNA polymerase I subunit RPA49
VSHIDGQNRELMVDVNGPSAFIPVPNMTTDDVTRVYPRESIVPSAEWAVIDIKPFIKAKDEKERLGHLPSRHSAWVNNKLGEVIRGPAELRKDNMYVISSSHRYQLMFSKYLYYLSMLQEFSRKVSKIATLKPSEMGEQFPNVPSQIITGLLDRFTETSGKKYTLTDSRKTKIMAWQCVLYLTIDGWSTDISKVATDLKMKPPKSVFRYTLSGR